MPLNESPPHEKFLRTPLDERKARFNATYTFKVSQQFFSRVDRHLLRYRENVSELFSEIIIEKWITANIGIGH